MVLAEVVIPVLEPAQVLRRVHHVVARVEDHRVIGFLVQPLGSLAEAAKTSGVGGVGPGIPQDVARRDLARQGALADVVIEAAFRLGAHHAPLVAVVGGVQFHVAAAVRRALRQGPRVCPEVRQHTLVHLHHLLHAVDDGAGLAESQVLHQAFVRSLDHPAEPRCSDIQRDPVGLPVVERSGDAFPMGQDKSPSYNY